MTVPLLFLSISLLLLCLPCLCVLFCCFNGPDLCRVVFSSGAILFVTTRAANETADQSFKTSLRAGEPNRSGYPIGQDGVILGAFHSTKYSGLKFRVFHATNGTVMINQSQAIGFQVSRENTRSNGGLLSFVYLLWGCSTTLKLK